MTSPKLPSLRLFVAGVMVFLASVLALYLGAPRSEASMLTRVIVFALLIPPPVAFAAGILASVAGELRTSRAGAWTNAAAIFIHGASSIAVLQMFFAS
jgi:hypothetical protein